MWSLSVFGEFAVRLSSLLIAGSLFCIFAEATSGETNGAPSASAQAEVIHNYGIDPSSPLESRVKETPAAVLKMFEGIGPTAPTPHPLTEAERLQLKRAFAALPPLHRQILSERLHTVSFLDGMPNTALTSTINPDEPDPVFDVTIRAGILRQNVSDWLTEKERTCFDTGGALNVSVEAGKRDALLYVLLHEGTHMVDSCLGITPAFRSGGQPADAKPATSFTRGVWDERLMPAPKYRDPLLERTRFRFGGEILPIYQVESVYRSLRRTPFVSLYGSRNWYDDLAEFVAVYHFTKVLKQPYRIVIRKEGKVVFDYKPMKSDLVRSRASEMKRFYKLEKP